MNTRYSVTLDYDKETISKVIKKTRAKTLDEYINQKIKNDLLTLLK
jgi:hypothetical protein